MLSGKTLDILILVGQLLNDQGIPWALIGGAAMPLRGRIRSTRDLDVLLRPQAMADLIEKLRESGFAHHPRADRHRLEMVDLYRFWYPISDEASLGLDIQVPREVNGLLDNVLHHATCVMLNGVGIQTATAEDLILLKLLAFRPIDRADAIELLELNPDLNREYLGSAARELGLNDRWDDVLKTANANTTDGSSDSTWPE